MVDILAIWANIIIIPRPDWNKCYGVVEQGVRLWNDVRLWDVRQVTEPDSRFLLHAGCVCECERILDS